ncbi:hypothetical protein L195_g036254 [Trifolium pratense]|uniref:Uncharacterized protein n=1 Tax=Trifolium pratense TaxID=57577 RepID=A0A2K3LP15_TRIPR|nr:hypothetical protein L195_g036254 [Trifolium pratense]
MLVISKHSSNSHPTVFSSVIDYKNGTENVLGDSSVHPLQNYRVEAVPELLMRENKNESSRIRKGKD